MNNVQGGASPLLVGSKLAANKRSRVQETVDGCALSRTAAVGNESLKSEVVRKI